MSLLSNRRCVSRRIWKGVHRKDRLRKKDYPELVATSDGVPITNHTGLRKRLRFCLPTFAVCFLLVSCCSYHCSFKIYATRIWKVCDKEAREGEAGWGEGRSLLISQWWVGFTENCSPDSFWFDVNVGYWTLSLPLSFRFFVYCSFCCCFLKLNIHFFPFARHSQSNSLSCHLT